MRNMEKTFSYNDWWDGNIVLENTSYEFDKENPPPLVPWAAIFEEDARRIKEKQKQLFEEIVDSFVEKYKAVFRQRYGSSKMKSKLLETEKQLCNEIMYLDLANVEEFYCRQWQTRFDSLYLKKIQIYITDSINGREDYSFMQSPNCKFKITSFIPHQIYAHIIWYYNKWLEDFEKNESQKGMTEDSQFDSEVARIFKNPNCYNFFLSLKDDVRDRCKLADYSFIYRRMKKDGYINQYVVDNEYRDFIKRFNIEIDKTKLLDYCTTELKEQNYQRKKTLFPSL